MTGTPPPSLDRELHHPTRLALVAYLSSCTETEFGVLRDYCGISDSVTSKTVSALEKLGYVTVRKGYVGKRPRTWVALTRQGLRALETHLAALEEIVATAKRAGATAEEPT
ncbi:transcriptional regulator [Streptomyces actuosus]|uniref:Transcriptional regulator n=1 Tax=Streptomyces actuosus TaxID=1885 RepID=A0ABS2W0Y8_STRAS|nr:transcriptional regulator [Streptomyces actuosus]MBN0049072.1 transcriptional regulator [Streptomyces actuosus]